MSSAFSLNSTVVGLAGGELGWTLPATGSRSSLRQKVLFEDDGGLVGECADRLQLRCAQSPHGGPGLLPSSRIFRCQISVGILRGLPSTIQPAEAAQHPSSPTAVDFRSGKIPSPVSGARRRLVPWGACFSLWWRRWVSARHLKSRSLWERKMAMAATTRVQDRAFGNAKASASLT